MKNITLRVDDATYRKARIRAAEQGTSVSAMVRDFLNHQASANESHENRRTEALESLYTLAESQADYNATPVPPFAQDVANSIGLRNLDDDTLARLTNRASRHRRSLAQEIESLLMDAARMIPSDETAALSLKLALKTASTGKTEAKWDRESIYDDDGR